MTILKEIYNYKIGFVENQKKIKSQEQILKNIYKSTSNNFNFSNRLENEKFKISIIGELKRASPSLGNFVEKKVNLSKIAKTYEENGISCLSILTDEKYFQGSVKDLIDIREITSLPILRKDFIVDEYQIYESKLIGADCILIILAMLDQNTATKFEEIAISLGLDVIVEIHNEEELNRAMEMKSQLIGINNRNLNNFETSIETSIRLNKFLLNNNNKIYISESGFHGHEAVHKIASLTSINNFLIGEYLMKSDKLAYDINKILN